LFTVEVNPAGEKMHAFNKIETTRAYQVVINQLEDAIVSGKLTPGEKLPNERDLTDAFGTSRRTLREAFRVLEQKGLLEIKIGSKGGTFVADRVGEKLTETLSLYIRKESVRYEELAEFRAATEGTAAALAANRASREDFDLMARNISEIKRLLDEDVLDIEQFVEKEMALHLVLARLSGNTMYTLIVKAVHDILLRPAFLLDSIDSDYVRRIVADWNQILDALTRRAPSEAKHLMEHHVYAFAGLDAPAHEL
jgi:GntR family transcriptional regulator, transcriptional repressor for pyruvate dehydrogenase complex